MRIILMVCCMALVPGVIGGKSFYDSLFGRNDEATVSSQGREEHDSHRKQINSHAQKPTASHGKKPTADSIMEKLEDGHDDNEICHDYYEARDESGIAAVVGALSEKDHRVHLCRILALLEFEENTSSSDVEWTDEWRKGLPAIVTRLRQIVEAEIADPVNLGLESEPVKEFEETLAQILQKHKPVSVLNAAIDVMEWEKNEHH